MDYKGEPTPSNWPSINSHFGVLDIAGYEKDSAAYYRVWWRNDSTIVTTVPSTWTPAPGAPPAEVVVFAIAASAELILNGASLGTQNISAYSGARFANVPRTPGTLVAKSYDASGALLATTTLTTTGAAAALRVTAEAGSESIAADGADVALVRIEVVDAAGAVVPDASPQLTYVAGGGATIIGIANGDPNDHTPDKVGMPDLPYGGVWTRAAFNGLGRAIVRGPSTPGSFNLTVSSPGLTSGSVVITAA